MENAIRSMWMFFERESGEIHLCSNRNEQLLCSWNFLKTMCMSYVVAIVGQEEFKGFGNLYF